MIAIETVERTVSARSCHECFALQLSEPLMGTLYALSLPGIGMRVMLCEHHLRQLDATISNWVDPPSTPVPMRLTCPACNTLHIDEGDFATKPHHTHACQACGAVWRPAIVPTVGVRFLPGFKNDTKAGS